MICPASLRQKSKQAAGEAGTQEATAAIDDDDDVNHSTRLSGALSAGPRALVSGPTCVRRRLFQLINHFKSIAIRGNRILIKPVERFHDKCHRDDAFMESSFSFGIGAGLNSNSMLFGLKAAMIISVGWFSSETKLSKLESIELRAH